LKDYFLFKLSGKFDISQVHEILLCDVGIEILLVVVKGIEGVVVELAFILIVVH
jgi:hypothetical protein